MTSLLKDTSSRDDYENQILWDNNINNVLFYPAVDESWDRTGGGNASWYLEETLPNDSFYGQELSSERWSFFEYRGTISGTVNNELQLTISGSDARGGVTSEGKWSLSGDFDIRLYMDESSYYNEYRGECASGLTVSFSESKKFRISKFFDEEDIGYATHYVEKFPLKITRWFNGSFSTSVGESDVTCLRMVREGDAISAYVSTDYGFTQVGSSMTGSDWAADANVEIEIETSRYNFYGTDFLGFAVSGTLTSPTIFSSDFRGPSRAFPERALLVVDEQGLSVLDDDDLSLWMRFRQSEDFMFKNEGANIAASEGRIYYTTASGVLCLDFVDDKATWYTDTEKRATEVGIAARNFKNSFYTVGASSFVPDNNVLDVDARYIDGNDFVVVGADTGVGILINRSEEKTEDTLSGRTQKVQLSHGGTLYWNYFDETTSVGKLNYRQSLQNLAGGPSTFSPTGYYDLTTAPVSISSTDINDISINQEDEGKVLLAHSFGIDYIDGLNRVTYGPEIVTNPINDPSFSNTIGISWFGVLSSLFNVFDTYISTDWSSEGTTSLKMTLQSSGSVEVGSYGGVYQQVNLSDVDRLYFDYKLVNTAPLLNTNYLDLVVMVNGTEVASYTDFTTSHEKYNNFVDVSSFTGVCTLMIVLKSKYEGDCVTTTTFYVDNIRTIQTEPDYGVIPTNKHEVFESLLWYTDDERKIFFATEDGYGAIDIDSDSLDFFTEIEGPVQLSSILSAEYVEYIDAV